MALDNQISDASPGNQQDTQPSVPTTPMQLPPAFGAQAAAAPDNPTQLIDLEPPKEEMEDLAVKFLDIIVQDLISGDVARIEDALNKIKGMQDFMRGIRPSQEELAEFINENLINKLCQSYLTNPKLQENFVNVLNLIFVNFQKLIPPGRTRILSVLTNNLINQLSSSPDARNAMTEEMPNIIVGSCLEANNLHNITRTLEGIDDSNREIVVGVYTKIFTEVIDDQNFLADRRALFIADALKEALLDEVSSGVIAIFISRLENSQIATQIQERILDKVTLDREFGTVFLTKLRGLILDNATDEKDRKVFIEFVIKTGGFKFVAQLLGISGRLDNSPQMLRIFVYIEPYIDSILTSGNQEDISALIEYMGQVSLRIDFVQLEWVNIQIKILRYIDSIKQKADPTVEQILTDVLLKSITSRIVAGLQATLVSSSNEDTQKALRSIVRLIVPPNMLSIFSSEDRVAVYRMFIDRYLEDPSDSYISYILKYLYKAEQVQLEELATEGYEFVSETDTKTTLMSELLEALKLSEEKKRALVDRFFADHTPNDSFIVYLILRDPATLEYYRDKAYKLELERVGTSEIEGELEEIKELVLDRLRPEGKAERMKAKVEKMKKNPFYRVLFWFDKGPTKSQRRREMAKENVEKEDRSSIEKGIHKLSEIIQNPSQVKLLIRAVETDPETYAIVTNLIEELYQFVDELDVSKSTEKDIYTFLRLTLDSTPLVELMPPHIRVIKLEMWKDRLDQFEDITDTYGATKKEILTKKGQSVVLNSISGREKRRYESKLANKFKSLSTPRGECLTEIVTLYKTDRKLFEIYASQPEFSNILEYAIDQYSMYPDAFLEISDAEKEFILFVVENGSVWNGTSDRVKFKLCTQILSLWVKQDPAGYDILRDLSEENDDTVDYSFKNVEVINFIGATFQQLPQDQRDLLIKFAGVNEKKGRARRTFEGLRDTLTRDNSNAYANSLNYVMAYLATRNRVNAKGFYDVVDSVVAERVTLAEQIKVETAAYKASEEIKDEAGEIDPTGALLTTERAADLDSRLKKSIDASIVFIDAFTMNPPLTFRVQTEVLDMIPRFIDLLVHGAERGYEYTKLQKVLEFINKLLDQATTPAYFQPPRVYIEILEEMDSRLDSYSQLMTGPKFNNLNTEIKKIRDLCEKRSIDAAGSIILASLTTIKSPVPVNLQSPFDVSVISENKLLKPAELQGAIKPVIELLFSNFDIVEKLIQTAVNNEQQDQLARTLARILLYVNIYAQPSISKQLTFFVTRLGSALPAEKRASIVSIHKEYQEKVKGLTTRRRQLPKTLQTQINSLAA